MKLNLLNKEKYSWLKYSFFYKNLDETGDLDVIYCSKYSNDIKLYIKVIIFWGVTYCPQSFYRLFFYTIKYELLTEKFKLKTFLDDFISRTHSDFLIFLRECLPNKSSKLENLENLKHFEKSSISEMSQNSESCEKSSKSKMSENFEYFEKSSKSEMSQNSEYCEKSSKSKMSQNSESCEKSSKSQNSESCEKSSKSKMSENFEYFEKSSKLLFYIGLKYNQIDFLKYMCAKEDIYVENNDKYILKLVKNSFEKIYDVAGYFENPFENIIISFDNIYFEQKICRNDKNIFEIAAVNGNLNTFNFLWQRGFVVSENVFEISIKYGNLDFVKRLLNRNYKYKVAYSYCAIYYNRYEIFKYFHENKYEIPRNINNFLKKGLCFEYCKKNNLCDTSEITEVKLHPKITFLGSNTRSSQIGTYSITYGKSLFFIDERKHEYEDFIQICPKL